MTGLLRNRKIRDVLLQALFLAVVIFVIVAGWRNASTMLESQNMISGFDFLEKSTGWNVSFSLIPLSANDPYWLFFVAGILNTLFLGISGLALATVIGILIGVARTSGNDVLMLLGTIYVEFFRNIPLILQVFFWYAVVTRLPNPREAIAFGPVQISSRGIYLPVPNVENVDLFAAVLAVVVGLVAALWLARRRRIARASEARRWLEWGALGAGLAVAVVLITIGRLPEGGLIDVPRLQGLNIRGGLRVTPEFAALLIAIGIYGGAYIGEIVRGGFLAVGRGQIEAARALGLSAWYVFTRIRFPLALRAMLPILANQYVWLIKATTLGIAVGFTDFFMIVAVTINQSGQTLEAIAILMGGFLVINLTLAAIFNRINRAIALKGNQVRN